MNLGSIHPQPPSHTILLSYSPKPHDKIENVAVMSMVSKRQKEDGPEAVAAHPDFQHPWIKELLADPQKKWTSQVPRMALGNTVTNSMFEKILGGPDCIRAHLSFNRPCREPDAVKGVEECWLLAIGHDIDGKTGRAHGGFNACVLDQIMGSVSHHVSQNDGRKPCSCRCKLSERLYLPLALNRFETMCAI